MKNALKYLWKLLAVTLFSVVLCLSFASCEEEDNTPEEELLLVKGGKARFTVVASSVLDTKCMDAAAKLVSDLRDLGLEVGDAISDGDADAVTDCEVIIGAEVKNREGCEVTVRELGSGGYVIKIVGNKVVIAAGSDDMLKEAIKQFTKNVLGIGSEIEVFEDETVTVLRTYTKKKTTDYHINEITVGDVKLSEFVFSYENNAANVAVARYLQTAIYDNSGVYVKLPNELSEGEEYSHKFVIKLSSGSSGMLTVSKIGEDLVMSCPDASRYALGARTYIQSVILDENSGIVDLSEKYEWDIAYRYSEFGAVGDGKTDDFEAMLKTHETANNDGLKVMADKGASYFIGKSSLGKAIPVKTNVDLLNATITVDDKIVNPFDSYERSKNVFEILPSKNCESYDLEESAFIKMGLVGSTVGEDTVYKKSDNSPVFTKGQSKINLTFNTKVMLKITNSGEKVYIRYGGNANSGSSKSEIILVDKNGNVDPTTPILWDYKGLSAVEVYPIDEEPITFKGGTFITIANQLSYNVPAGSDCLTGDQYYYYGRGILVSRSNTKVEGITHRVQGESTAGGYPYTGWLNTTGCNNVLVENVSFWGHRTYIEDRDVNGDGKPDTDKGTSMGTYDIAASYGNNITWKNCSQGNSITHGLYWGVMGSNFVKNLTFDTCTLSRFDAHQGVANATIKNSTIGHTINCIGSGTLTMINVTKKVGDSFISLREDYGSTWEGDAIIKNCTLLGYESAGKEKDIDTRVTVTVAGIFLLKYVASHNFGYTTYMPQNVTIENFKFSESIADMYVFYVPNNTLNDLSFTDAQNPYQAVKTINLSKQSKDIKLSNATVLGTMVNESKITVSGDGASKLKY